MEAVIYSPPHKFWKVYLVVRCKLIIAGCMYQQHLTHPATAKLWSSIRDKLTLKMGGIVYSVWGSPAAFLCAVCGD